MSRNAAFVILFLLLNISRFPPISSLNQEGLSLLSWLSMFNSSSSAAFFSSWNPADKNPCRWAYVRCSSDGFVKEISITSIHIPTTFPTEITSFSHLTSIIISRSNLTGEIPESIGNLSSSLVTLDLSFNALTGRIPAEIGKLSKVQLLALNTNFLQGEIPAEIGNCTRLKQIELFDNQLSGKISAQIWKLTVLEIFRAGGNSGLSGELPEEISNCKQLAFLGLADSSISGKIPSSLGELENLRTLSVYTANLTGNIPREIGNCLALEDIFLYENQLFGNIPEEIGSLKNLKRLLLWQNNISGRIPGSLGNCSALEVIDFSLNYLIGDLPLSLASLVSLGEVLFSQNNLSGEIPAFFGNFSGLKQLELDNNQFHGEIPATIGQLKELSLFYAWQNRLQGSIPAELASCEKLQALDLSHNFLTGSIPNPLFNLKNLSQLLLLSNQLSGEIPPDIGNCTSLVRLRLSLNGFVGSIPSTIGALQSLTFLELSRNQFTREIPPEIGNCTQLEMLDLHGNKLMGKIPESFQYLVKLNVLDLSMNSIGGSIPQGLGKLVSLNKLTISVNNITGSIPRTLGLCKDLQLLDLSSNRLTGSIPDEIGYLQEMDILLNLSRNSLTGEIPKSFSNLTKLAGLDISHNKLSGSLTVLGNLFNLVSLNVSYNSFSGTLPDTDLFHNLPADVLSGNKNLCIDTYKCHGNLQTRRSASNLVLYSLLGIAITTIIVVAALLWFLRSQETMSIRNGKDEWEFTMFQKLDFSLNDIIARLSDSSIIGKGCSGVVYRVETPAEQVVAVKNLWPLNKRELPHATKDFFSAEVRTLGSVRHKNILRLLGYCSNGRTRLLVFDYISNGSLARLLHEKQNIFLDWDARYKIILGAAHGLAYLHHDCVPPIIHRDIKANNILVGPNFQAYLADFGLAKLLDQSECSRNPHTIAGSYGYIAPEYGYSTRITEKSDVYSYGVVLLEVLTRKQPTDHRIPEGSHIATWLNREIKEGKCEFTSILDQQLLTHSSTQIQEMIQVLGVALLCVNATPEERPSMKDVAAMLGEIRNGNADLGKRKNEMISGSKSLVQFSSFSRSSETTSNRISKASLKP